MPAQVFILRDDKTAHALYDVLKGTWRIAAAQDRPVVVTVHDHEDPRTEAQNRRFWRLMHIIAGNAWVAGGRFSAEAWAEHYRKQFLGVTTTPKGRELGISTRGLTVPQFSEFLTKIEHHATHDLGLDLSAL